MTANARLIAAAPVLAEALRALEKATRLACCRESIRGRDENHAARCNTAIDAANAARAALKQAGVEP